MVNLKPGDFFLIDTKERAANPRFVIGYSYYSGICFNIIFMVDSIVSLNVYSGRIKLIGSLFVFYPEL
jgi:hypothetical protein